MFWPFLEKGATGYTQQREFWHGTSLGTWIKIQEEPILKDHVLSIKGNNLDISRKRGYRINPAMWNLAWNIPGHND